MSGSCLGPASWRRMDPEEILRVWNKFTNKAKDSTGLTMAELLDENENPQFERLLTLFGHIFGACFIKRDYSSEDPRRAGLNLMNIRSEDDSVAQRTFLSLCLYTYIPSVLQYIHSPALPPSNASSASFPERAESSVFHFRWQRIDTRSGTSLVSCHQSRHVRLKKAQTALKEKQLSAQKSPRLHERRRQACWTKQPH
jgi:hypothetical protein